MQFNADEYYRVSLERMIQARKIYEGGTAYALATYCGGLAVESLLRAFRWTEDTSFEGRHNLTDLLKASKLLQIGDAYMRSKGSSEIQLQRSGEKLREAIQQVVAIWHNNLRFASEASFKRILRELGRLQGIKGDALKKNAMDILNAAQTVIDHGETLWTSKIRS